MLAPRHLIFTAVEGAIVDSQNGSFAEAEEALSELDRRHIPLILLTSRTRAEIEPIRRKLQHGHPFVTEGGGGIFFPDGYFNVRIPGAERAGRYLRLALGRPYDEVTAALDDISEDTSVGVTGFHHMSAREVADNTGLRPPDAGHARNREFDELFFFTSAGEQDIERFITAARERGFVIRPGSTFWHFSSGCDAGRAVRLLTQMFRDATRLKLRAVGISSSKEDVPWLRAVDQAVILPGTVAESSDFDPSLLRNFTSESVAGPKGWSTAILNIIS